MRNLVEASSRFFGEPRVKLESVDGNNGCFLSAMHCKLG